MKTSLATANALLTLKTWSDKTGTDLTRLNHRGIEKALAETGLTALDITKLASRASTFTQGEYDSIVKANQLTGELTPAAQAPVQQKDVFGTTPDVAWFDQKLSAAEASGWTFKISIDLWPDQRAHGKHVVNALNGGETIIASRKETWHSPDSSFSDTKTVERPFTTLGGLQAFLEEPGTVSTGSSRDILNQARTESRGADAKSGSGPAWFNASLERTGWDDQ